MPYMGPQNELSYTKWAGPAIPFGWNSCNTDAETFAESTASTYPATAPVSFVDEKETHCSNHKSRLMKKQINPNIKAHLIRGAFYLLLLLAVCVIPFALAQRNTERVRHTGAQVHHPKGVPPAPAGGVYEAWVARYNGTGNGYDEAKTVAVDNSGKVYVAGTIWGS